MKVFRDDGFWDEVEYLVERFDAVVENRTFNLVVSFIPGHMQRNCGFGRWGGIWV